MRNRKRHRYIANTVSLLMLMSMSLHEHDRSPEWVNLGGGRIVARTDFPHYRTPLGPNTLSVPAHCWWKHTTICDWILYACIRAHMAHTIVEISEIRRLTAQPLFTSRGAHIYRVYATRTIVSGSHESHGCGTIRAIRGRLFVNPTSIHRKTHRKNSLSRFRHDYEPTSFIWWTYE
jgi:hypothetical protein